MSELVHIDTALYFAPAIILPGGDVITMHAKDWKVVYSLRICRDRVLVMDGDKVTATFAGVYTVLVSGESRIEDCDKHE